VTSESTKKEKKRKRSDQEEFKTHCLLVSYFLLSRRGEGKPRRELVVLVVTPK